MAAVTLIQSTMTYCMYMCRNRVDEGVTQHEILSDLFINGFQSNSALGLDFRTSQKAGTLPISMSGSVYFSLTLLSVSLSLLAGL